MACERKEGQPAPEQAGAEQWISGIGDRVADIVGAEFPMVYVTSATGGSVVAKFVDPATGREFTLSMREH